MFGNKKVDELQQEIEDLHRRLDEKDEQLAQKDVIIISQRKSYESLQTAYNGLLSKVRKNKALINEDSQDSDITL